MKKNIAMRLASGLMLSCLLSTCVISGTFAKYTTSETTSDTARVAKFGVEIEANGATFAKIYENDVAADAGTEVKADVKVVAPGTKGSMAAMTISGIPEVAVEVKYEATLTLTGWDINGAEADGYYCPIIITVNETSYNGNDYATADLFAAAVVGAINGYTKTYDAGQNLSDEAIVATPDVSWEWKINGGVDQTDTNDTILGDAGTAEIVLSILTTVSQVD